MIQLRPHHFLCTVAYQGMGYSAAFIKNYDRLAQKIKNNQDQKIRVVFGLDTICTPCPHQNKNLNICNQNDVTSKLDAAHAAILNLHHGQITTFHDAKNRIRANMTLKSFQEACAPCEWQQLGVCEKALIKLKSQSQT